MDFITELSISTDWKGESYDSILVIINQLTKMVYYELVKATINALRLAEVILDVVVQYYSLSNSTVNDQGSLFTSKFWSSHFYFLKIKRGLSKAFHPQIDSQTEKQNSTMEARLSAFVNFEYNNWARLLLIAEFTYNNVKNASTGYTLFELNCNYHPLISYKENVDPCCKSKLVDDLANDLRQLVIVCQKNI